MIKTLLVIGAGGFLGSAGRYLVSIMFHSKNSNAFPWHTFIVNVVGCILLGFLVGYFEKNAATSNDVKMFLTMGICGGFTTFSAFTLEGMKMLKNAQVSMYFLYSFASVGVCLLAIFISYYLIMKLL